MSSQKAPEAPPPPQPDPPAAKAVFGSEDSPLTATKKRTAQRQSLAASYLTAAPTSSPGVGVQL